MKKIQATAALLTLPLLISVTACKDKDNASAPSASSSNKHDTSSTAQRGSASMSDPTGVGEDPMKRGGNYYQVLGTAQFDKTCNISAGAYNYTGVINGAGQVGPACAKVTERHARVNPIDDPAGFSKNGKASIPSVNGGHAYNGYFYNRSHMISASMGGSPKAENLITGTRMQNVGESNKGGMRYTEMQGEKYVATEAAKSCPLTYEVTPHYRNTTDAVPTWVEVDMQTCDKKINERVAVFNDAAGYTIDYATGAWKQK